MRLDAFNFNFGGFGKQRMITLKLFFDELIRFLMPNHLKLFLSLKAGL